nr:toxin TcdB middle/N-terminal domain-containing protein [Marinibactrum halimedae]
MVLASVQASWAVDNSGLKPTLINLPDGPGSISGLGAAFSPSLNTGTSSQSLSFTLPPGKAGFQPSLSLDYNSGFANGIAGLGRDLSIPMIKRLTDKGLPTYTQWPSGDNIDNDKDGDIDELDEFDEFIFSSGSKLVLVDGEKRLYRTEVDESKTIFEYNDSGWIAHQPNGMKLFFSVNENSVIAEGKNVFQWNVTAMEDVSGNRIEYIYSSLDETKQRYLTEIRYNQDMNVVFNYDVRPDAITNFTAGFEVNTRYRLASVAMRQGERQLRRYTLDYAPSSRWTNVSMLTRVTLLGSDDATEFPATTYTYTPFDPEKKRVVSQSQQPNRYLGNGNIDFVDLNADALPDVISTSPRRHEYWLNQGGDENGQIRWSQGKSMNRSVNASLTDSFASLADIDGDGRVDLLRTDTRENAYYYKIDESLSWKYSGDFGLFTGKLKGENTRLMDINHDKRIDLVETVKDRRGRFSGHRVWLNLGDNQWTDGADIPHTPDVRYTTFDSASTHLADMNGDGLQDLVYVEEDRLRYFPGRGLYGFDQPVEYSNFPAGRFDETKFQLADLNSDGKSDLIYFRGDNATIWFNLGLDAEDNARWSAKIDVSSPDGRGEDFRLLDINGNGSVDIVWLKEGKGFNYVDFSPEEQPYQIKAIKNGLGSTTTIEYVAVVEEMLRDQSQGQEWSKVIPFGMQVVKGISITDGLSAQKQRRVFQYHDAYYDSEDKTFRGFESSEDWVIGDTESHKNSTPSLVNHHKYHTGAIERALRGKLTSTEARAEDGSVFSHEQTQWLVKEIAENVLDTSERVTFAVPSERQVDYIEQGRAEPVRLAWAYEYDDYGNTLRVEEKGRLDAGWDDERTTIIQYSSSYASGLERWLLNLPVETQVLDSQGKLVKKTQFFYDDESFSGTNLGEFKRGLLTLQKEWVQPDISDKTIAIQRQRYDQFGNVVAVYDPLWGQAPGHWMEVTYDNYYKTFPVTETIDTGALRLTASATYDTGFGQVLSSIDFNGQATSFEYDALGRLKKMVKPGDSAEFPTISYDYQMAQPLSNDRTINWIETRQRESAGGGTIDSRSFMDGLGRNVMTRSESSNAGEVIVTDHVRFDSRGNAIESFSPYFSKGLSFSEAGTNASVLVSYDALGRALRTYQPQLASEQERRYSEITYLPSATRLQDEEQTHPASPHYGRFKLAVYDGLLTEGQGRLRQLHEEVAITDKGDPGAPTLWTTYYDYDALGNFTQLTDAQGNKREMAFDALGRNYFTNDPNRGYQWVSYDDAGNAVGIKDARGRVVVMNYDGVNRLAGTFYDLNDEELAATGAQSLAPYQSWSSVGKLPSRSANERYQYDVNGIESEPGALLRGRLSTVWHEAGYKAFSYDTRGNLIRQHQLIGEKVGNDFQFARTFTQTYQFDSADRLTQKRFSDGTQVSYQYNARGLLSRVPGVISDIQYAASGQPTTMSYANGIQSDWQYDNRQRLAAIHDRRLDDNISLRALQYSFDGVSNLLQIEDVQPEASAAQLFNEVGKSFSGNKKEFDLGGEYAYDDVYRLTQAQKPTQWGAREFRYDRIGNLLTQSTQEATRGSFTPSPKVETLLYANSQNDDQSLSWNRLGRAPKDGPGPHAMTAVQNNWGTVNRWFYDQNGNVRNQGGTRYNWDDRNRLVQATQNNAITKYVYDENNLQKLKITEGSDGQLTRNYYIDENSEVKNGGLVKYVSVLGRKVAQTSQAGGEFIPESYFLANHTGSTELQLNELGTVTNLFAYEPYGKIRAQAGDDTATDYLFLNREHDNTTGLDYLEQRHLMAHRARFISPDPIFALPERFSDPQHWSPYSYGRGNPLRYVDPTGEAACPSPCLNGPARIKINSWMSFTPEQVHRLPGLLPMVKQVNVTTGPITPSSYSTSYTYGFYLQYKRSEVPGNHIWPAITGDIKTDFNTVNYEYVEVSFTETVSLKNGSWQKSIEQHEDRSNDVYFGNDLSNVWAKHNLYEHNFGSWVAWTNPDSGTNVWKMLKLAGDASKMRPGAGKLHTTTWGISQADKRYPGSPPLNALEILDN